VSISGYSDVLSPQPGGALNLYVATDAPQFRVEFYRAGATLAGPLTGLQGPAIQPVTVQNPPPGDPRYDWGWPAYSFTLPPAWGTGVYIAMFVEVDQSGNDVANQPLDRGTANGVDRKAMFVVRGQPDSVRPILLKIPTATYQAYNYTGGGSSYRPGYAEVSLRRPGCGTGGITTFAQQGTPYYQLDVYDPSSDRMNLVHLEAPFIAWLEDHGYADQVDYCSDFDLHFVSGILDPYQLLVSVGHDEYWSEDMRQHVADFVAQGRHVAFFSGNTCYKHITFTAPWQFTNDGTWAANNKPAEDSFTGVSYVHANGRWDDWRQVVGYTLQHTDHWILQGVNGPVLGDVYNNDYNDPNQRAGLIGYECDGAPATLQNGVMIPNGPPTPGDFLILGYAQLDGSWEDGIPDLDGTNLCTMGLYTNSGVAFTVGTVDWARVLADGREPRAETLTRNVLDTLSVRMPAGWASRGAQLTSTPAVAANADGRLEAFGRGYDGALHHVWQTAASNGWAGWAAEGGALAGDGHTPTRLAAVCNADGRLSVFARFSDASIWHITQTAPNNGWGAWTTLYGNVPGDPAVGVNADGRLEVFVRGFDGHLYHCWQTSPDATFSNWADQQGSLASNPVVGNNADGRLEVFARWNDGSLRHLWQVAPSDGWVTWASFGGTLTGDPAVGVNADGRLEVFARGADNALWHIWQTAPNGGWVSWVSLGGVLTSDPAVGLNADGRLEVFVRGADNGVWHIWQTAPNSGWAGWASLGGALAGVPTVSRNTDGRLEVFAVSVNRTLWHRWQNSPGAW